MRGVKRLRHHPQRKVPVSWSLLLLTISSLDLTSFRHLVNAAGLIPGWYFGTRISELINFRLCSIVLYGAHGTILSLLDPYLLDRFVEIDLKFGFTKVDHLRFDSLTHQAICAGLLLDKMQPVCRRLRTLVSSRVDTQAGNLRSHMCLGTSVLLPLPDACQAPSPA